ncbi:hypothetical protein Noda2021_08110 [Candidatus Dependentiae bacterium Noda2021]|nr:hypothetical protein Noda2021_08110 [Candidatus Dependentiae bacterium Noda2021]
MKFFTITLLSIASLSLAQEKKLQISPQTSPKGSPQKELMRKLSAATLKRLERSQNEKIKEHRQSSSDYVAYKAAIEVAKTKGDLTKSVKDVLEESEGHSYSPNTIERITAIAETVSKELETKDPDAIVTLEQELKQQEKELKKQLDNEIIPEIRTIANARAEYQNKKQEKKLQEKAKRQARKQKQIQNHEEMRARQKANNKKVKLFFKNLFKQK